MKFIVNKNYKKYAVSTDLSDEPLGGGGMTIAVLECVSIEDFEKLSNIIKDLFISANINNFIPLKDNADWSRFYVDFSDSADEAAFIMWSSSGIEI